MRFIIKPFMLSIVYKGDASLANLLFYRLNVNENLKSDIYECFRFMNSKFV